MTAEHAPDPPADGRVSIGTPGLDEMLHGGLVGRRPYLVVGPSGTGKSSLALQFLIEGVRKGERVLLVTIEEPPNEIRLNHRGLGPELDAVEVFDAIPDIMRYERVPFKDIAAVRHASPLREVPLEIRRSPELSAVEVTLTGLEQMLRTEVQRRNYSRLVIDSLTALQYFCMKGFDPVAGAQAFLRFLSDLRVTTILTVESPLEDADTPERMLARGEIRLFRWELDDRTVRAVGVEKFRGSAHDVRLHPYRLGTRGLDVNLGVTISRDTRQLIETPRAPEPPSPTPASLPEPEPTSPLDPLGEVVRDLVLVGAEVAPLRAEIEAALGASAAGDVDRAQVGISRASALALGLSDSLRERMRGSTWPAPQVAEAYQRLVQRSEAARAGIAPTKLTPTGVLAVQLAWVLSLIPRAALEPATLRPSEVAPLVSLPVASLGSLADREPRMASGEGAVPSGERGVAVSEEVATETPSESSSPSLSAAPELGRVAESARGPGHPGSSEVGVPSGRIEPGAFRQTSTDAGGLAGSRPEHEPSPSPAPSLPQVPIPRHPGPARGLERAPSLPSPETRPSPTKAPTSGEKPARSLSGAFAAGGGAVAASVAPARTTGALPPPTLPPGAVQKTPRSTARSVEPPVPPPAVPAPPRARESREGRPPLPTLPSDPATRGDRTEPPGSVRGRPLSPPAPLPNLVPPVGSGAASSSAPALVSATAATPKRKRKTTSVPRKRLTTSPAATPPPEVDIAAAPTATLPPEADAMVGSTKPKRRPARKRKAPTVVSARAGPIPPSGETPAPAPPPVEPLAEATAPPKEGS